MSSVLFDIAKGGKGVDPIPTVIRMFPSFLLILSF